METLGDRVRRLREGKHWTGPKLGLRCGISQATISDIETGKTDDPRLYTVQAIAKALETTIRYLVSGIGNPKEDLPEDELEAEAVLLLRRLRPKQRKAWIASGKALIDEEPNHTPDGAQEDEAPKKRAGKR